MGPSACQPFFIGIGGGTASGKSMVCSRIMQILRDQSVVLLSLDAFYRDLSEEEAKHPNEVNFDNPAAFDIDRLVRCIDDLRDLKSVDVPVYDFISSRRRLNEVRRVNPADVIIVEGILVLHLEELLRRFNMKLFVDSDEDVCLARRIRRDTSQRQRDVEGVLEQYIRFVKPSFEAYILPSKLNADVIIPWGEENPVAVNLIAQHVLSKLSQANLGRIYGNLHIMHQTRQTRGMHTVLRSRTTDMKDFVFYADRLIRIIVEEALSALPFDEVTVTTPTEDRYLGVKSRPNICGISLVRSGETMENGLRACCAGVRIGKVLIKDRTIMFEKLPPDVGQRFILIMEPVLAAGESVKILLEHLISHYKLDASKIVLLTLIASPQGIANICSEYPKTKLITSEVDEGLDDFGQVVPGIGDFGDRYFGTDGRKPMDKCELEASVATPTNQGKAWEMLSESTEDTPTRHCPDQN